MPSVCSQLNLLSRASPSRLVSGEKEVQRMRVCVAKAPLFLKANREAVPSGGEQFACLLARLSGVHLVSCPRPRCCYHEGNTHLISIWSWS